MATMLQALRAACLALLWQAACPQACTIVAAGREASASGAPLVCHTDDSGPETTDFRFIRVPRKQWPAGSKRPLYNWGNGYPRVVSSALSPEYAPVNGQTETAPVGEIPQVPETYAYWDMDYGVQNEFGLSIGESTCNARTVGWPATPDKPYGFCKVGIEDLSKLALERCKTARCAVQTMGDIAVEQGFYSADSGPQDKPDFMDSAEALVVADSSPGEMWIFNVLTGRNNASAIWAAERVPPANVVAVGNAFTIRKMNLSDSENWLYSKGVTELAEEMGWWSPKDDKPGFFDFARAYAYTPPDHNTMEVIRYYGGRRMWRIFSLLSPEEGAKLDPEKGNLPHTVDPYPNSVPAPKSSVTPRKLMSVLRDHYEGTPYDLTQGMAAGPFGSPNRGPLMPKGLPGLWERAIAMHRTSWSFVLEARPQGASVTWLGLDSPHGTAYLPFFGAATQGAPEGWKSSEGFMAKFNSKVAWWAFNMVSQYQDLNFGLINKDVIAKANVIEAEGEKEMEAWQAELQRAGADRPAALERLTAKSNAFAEAKVAEWWPFAFSLFAKFGRYVVTYNESEGGEVPMRYPEWWALSPEVGYASWSPEGPFHGVKEAVKLAAAQPGAMPAAAFAAVMAVALSSFVGAAAYRVGFQRGVRQELLAEGLYSQF